jgi:hypothetical protein
MQYKRNIQGGEKRKVAGSLERKKEISYREK